MPEPTSPQYTNPYSSADTAYGASTQGGSTLEGPQNAQASQVGIVPTAPEPKPRVNWKITVILTILGLLIGVGAGYLAGDVWFFQSEREQSAQERTQLEERITLLEQQLANQQAAATLPAASTSTSGTGTAPVPTGVTPDPITADWGTYTSQQYKFSFRYPSDYEVREVVVADDDPLKPLTTIGVYRPGDEDPSAFVHIFKSTKDKGPDVRNLKLYQWTALLPTRISEEAAGAGLIASVQEVDEVVNGSVATKLQATEGQGTKVTEGGANYSAYLFMDVNKQSYLVGSCSDKANSQLTLVGCPLMTTFTIER